MFFPKTLINAPIAEMVERPTSGLGLGPHSHYSAACPINKHFLLNCSRNAHFEKLARSAHGKLARCIHCRHWFGPISWRPVSCVFTYRDHPVVSQSQQNGNGAGVPTFIYAIGYA